MKAAEVKEMGAIAPFIFFDLDFSIGQDLSKLPDPSVLSGEKKRLDVKMQWTEKGLICQFTAKTPFEEEDTLILFVDTRAVKNAKSLHPYCHQIQVGLEKAEEVTDLRGDDQRDLTGPFPVIHGGKKLEVRLEGLYGFDPVTVKRIGFNYAYTAADGHQEHFALSSRDFDLIKHPNLWATGHLV